MDGSGGLRLRRIIVSAIRPPNSPARIDSIGKPGTGAGGTYVLVLVVLVLVILLLVALLLVVVDVVVEITVV